MGERAYRQLTAKTSENAHKGNQHKGQQGFNHNSDSFAKTIKQ